MDKNPHRTEPNRTELKQWGFFPISNIYAGFISTALGGRSLSQRNGHRFGLSNVQVIAKAPNTTMIKVKTYNSQAANYNTCNLQPIKPLADWIRPWWQAPRTWRRPLHNFIHQNMVERTDNYEASKLNKRVIK